jgi:hypothetical protein
VPLAVQFVEEPVVTVDSFVIKPKLIKVELMFIVNQ